jgi:SAM-dependent methyltransferase
MARYVWEAGDAYEAYVGRWSREIAWHFVGWLGVPGGRRWLDVGCGTGALTSVVLAAAHPALAVGVDPSRGFLAGRSGVVAGDAQALPLPSDRFDVVVSGLALNFVPRPEAAVAEFARVAAPGAMVASYVWDYAEGMQMMRHFWDAAEAVDPAAADLDEGRRFPICQEKPLAEAWAGAGLGDVATRLIEVPTVFAGFDDFWRPFLGGQGAAPSYLATLPEEQRQEIRAVLRRRLGDRTIMLTAAAWAVRGFKDL